MADAEFPTFIPVRYARAASLLTCNYLLGQGRLPCLLEPPRDYVRPRPCLGLTAATMTEAVTCGRWPCLMSRKPQVRPHCCAHGSSLFPGYTALKLDAHQDAPALCA